MSGDGDDVFQCQSSNYGSAYLIGPLTYSGWIVRRFGYRKAFVIGLCIYALSAILFYPSGAKRSFGGFCAAVFIMGSGLSSLETAGMPYIAVCGPPRWSELRVNLSCALQSSSSVTAIVIASYAILDGKNPHEHDSLKSVQYVYLGIGIFALILACAFFFAPIPEITDADMASQAAASAVVTGWTDKLGAASSFCYSGGQIALTSFFINYATEVDKSLTNKTAAHRLAIAQASFAAARFVCALLMRWLNPRHMLIVASIVTTGILSGTIGAKGGLGVALLTVEFVTKACVSPTTFTLSLRGLGRHTKRGASFLIASIVGGAVFSPLLGAVADKKGMNIAMVVPVVGIGLSIAFPVYANFWKAKELDGFRLGKKGNGDVEKTEGGQPRFEGA